MDRLSECLASAKQSGPLIIRVIVFYCIVGIVVAMSEFIHFNDVYLTLKYMSGSTRFDLYTNTIDYTPVGIINVIWLTLDHTIVYIIALFYIGTKMSEYLTSKKTNYYIFSAITVLTFVGFIFEIVYMILGFIPAWQHYASNNHDWSMVTLSFMTYGWQGILLLGCRLIKRENMVDITSRAFNLTSTY